MLNLPIAMQPGYGLTLLLVFFALGQSGLLPAVHADAPGIAITSPAGGAALQGQIAITGTSDLADFVSAEVAFTYSASPGPAWFPINESQAPVKSGLLANWDTTTISDGIYNLRLVVTLKDGTQKKAEIDGLRVRNYSPVETSTPTITPTSAPVIVTATTTPTLAPTRIRPEPTPLPTNPAGLSPTEIDLGILRGVGVAILLFGGLGLYLLARSWILRR